MSFYIYTILYIIFRYIPYYILDDVLYDISLYYLIYYVECCIAYFDSCASSWTLSMECSRLT